MASMTSVDIDSGKVEACIPADLIPQDKWPELLRKRMWFVKEHLPADCRYLVQFVDEAEQMYKPLGYKNAQDLIHRGLELDRKEIKHALDWLRLAKPNKPISLKDATILGKHGGDRKSGQAKNQVGITKLKSSNNDAIYALARLDRDHKELAAQVRAGKVSIHGAATQAGFRPKRISIILDVHRAAQQLIKYFSHEELEELKRLLM